MLPGCIASVDHDLGGSLPVDGPVLLVLHRGEEAFGRLRGHVVVYGGRVDVGDLLVELALGSPELADPLELLLEVLVANDGAAALEEPIVHRETLVGERRDHAVPHLRSCTGRSRWTL